LYNSLETIGFLAIDAGADKVHSALETLGSFYRNFLSKGDREIPLKREITIIKDYLSLQKLRYGDILNDEYEIAPDTEECLIPKLILQPLVENSIYHGIRMKGEQGTIKISSFLEDDDLHILVRDTGIGMTQEQIDKVLSKEKNEGTEEFNESFGLWGTIERIRCYCDKDDVVRIRSEIGEYTEIEFILGLQPKRWKPTAD
jgi:two-component system sensor histidine kinase YesM